MTFEDLCAAELIGSEEEEAIARAFWQGGLRKAAEIARNLQNGYSMVVKREACGTVAEAIEREAEK